MAEGTLTESHTTLRNQIRSDRGKAQIKPREFYTISQIADLLEIDEQTIYRFAKQGELPSSQHFGFMRFRGDDVKVFATKRGTRSPKSTK